MKINRTKNSGFKDLYFKIKKKFQILYGKCQFLPLNTQVV